MQKKIKSLFIFLLIFISYNHCQSNIKRSKTIDEKTIQSLDSKVVSTGASTYIDEESGSQDDITSTDQTNTIIKSDDIKSTDEKDNDIDKINQDIEKDTPENIVNIVLDVAKCDNGDDEKAYSHYVNNIEKAVANSIKVIKDVMAGDVKEQKKVIKDITKKMQQHMLKIVKNTMFKKCTKIYNNPKSKDGTYKINKLLKTFALDDDKIIRSPDFEKYYTILCGLYIQKAYDAKKNESGDLEIGSLDINFSDYLLQLFILGQLIDLKINFYENKFVSITDDFINKINCDNDPQCKEAKENIKIKSPDDDKIKKFLLLKIYQKNTIRRDQENDEIQSGDFCASIQMIQDGYKKIFNDLFITNDSIYKQAAKGLMEEQLINNNAEDYYNKTQQYNTMIMDSRGHLQKCNFNKN